MKEWINLTEYNWAYWVAGFFALLNFTKYLVELGIKVYQLLRALLFKKLGIETKKMRETRKWKERVQTAEEAIIEIKETSKQNVEMFISHETQVIEKFVDMRNEIVSELSNLQKKLDKQREEIEVVKKEFEVKNANDWRWDILDFFNSSRNGRPHHKEEWDHVIEQVKTYERYVELHDIDNGVLEEASIWLRKEYQEHLDKNDFLKV